MSPLYVIRSEVRATFLLAAPLALTQLAQMAMSFVDVMMIGRLGTAALAGGVLGSVLFFTPLLVCMGVVMAVNPMVAQAVGAGDGDEVGRSARQGLWLAGALGVPLVFLFGPSEWFLLAMGQEPEAASLAADYLLAIRWGIIPNLLFTALRGFCEGLARPRPVLIITLIAVLLNVFGNWVLMYGKFGFPALGLAGCGWSSSIVMAAMLVMLVIYIRWSPGLKTYRVFAGLRKPDRAHFRTLFKLGWPIGAQFGLEAGLFSAATLIIGLFGTTALAAHQIALNASSVTFMIPLGVGMAATVRVGQAAGAGDTLGSARAGWTAIAMGTAFMFGSAMLFWFKPEWVVWIYTGQNAAGPVDTAVVQLAAGLLAIAGVFQLFDGAQATAAGALRGLKDTRVPMLIGAMSYWIVGIGIGLSLAFGFGLEAKGIWWGLTSGLATAAVLLNARFRYLTGAVHRKRNEAISSVG